MGRVRLALFGLTALAPPGDIETRSAQLALPGRPTGTPAKPAETPTKYLEVSAARVGDVAFLALDCEALVEVGKTIRRQSPFSHTFILTNCNGGSGYLPPAHLFEERGYEVDLSGFAPQAAEMVVQNALKMLSSLRR
ncbi:hypothetical protein [Paludibaculum fermentans]|uniref:hypothetical protein n=1 Tax=Paludibaculum fermentans TaxID=1473598 RepID=UPI003EBA8EAA